MRERKPARIAIEAGAAAPAIQSRAKANAKAGRETRWHLMLVVFMRIAAALWLAEGLLHWHDILVPVPSRFETLPPLQSAALVVFAVLDLATAVGLWLVTPWGGVLWILAAAAQMAAIVYARGFFPAAELLFGVDGALIVAYLLLTYKAGQEEQEAGRR